MASRQRIALTCGWLAALAAPAAAADPGRLDLLAVEVARLAASPGAVHAAPPSWGPLVAVIAATTLAAFAGTYAGARRRLLRGDRDCREVTYRFRTDRPLHLKGDTLARLNGLLFDPKEPDPVPKKPGAGAPRYRPDRRSRFERARQLLENGHDAATVRELTGLQAAELDLLRAASAGDPR